jgi:uncharacterized protein (DUF2235 family)
MKRIILCLDGTWNSAYAKDKRKDGSEIIKPSNVLKMARAIEPLDNQGNQQLVYYDAGVGSLSKYSGLSNYILGKADKWFGGIWGAGFETNIEDALTFLVHNYSDGDEVYIFGFSRGAATARALTQFIAWMFGMPKKIDAYFIPLIFRYYIKTKGNLKSDTVLGEISQKVIEENKLRKKGYKKAIPFSTWSNVEIKFLGVWDTVLSLGSRIIPIAQRKFYLDKVSPASCVKNARQALAIDEKRLDFQPWIWNRPYSDTQSLKQRWFAGVHSNIGGGYDKDGLANITFHWMKNEVLKISPDFNFDQDFFKFYKKHYQAKLMKSKTFLYWVKDFLIGHSIMDYINNKIRMRKIITELEFDYLGSGLDIDFTALQRFIAKEESLAEKKRYRPKNLGLYICYQNLDNIVAKKHIEINKLSTSHLKKDRDQAKMWQHHIDVLKKWKAQNQTNAKKNA